MTKRLVTKRSYDTSLSLGDIVALQVRRELPRSGALRNVRARSRLWPAREKPALFYPYSLGAEAMPRLQKKKKIARHARLPCDEI